MNELALFSGAGGGILAGHLLGWRTVAAVEVEDYPRRVLLQRQADGILPRFPIWDDVRTFDGKPWRGKISIITGGFPCQDISSAGQGAGIDGERSGLWSEMARIISEIRPYQVFVENSPLLVGRGLTRVLGDIAQMGYDAKWCVLGSVDTRGIHKRNRMWILAYPEGLQRDGSKARHRGKHEQQSFPKLRNSHSKNISTNAFSIGQSGSREVWRQVRAAQNYYRQTGYAFTDDSGRTWPISEPCLCRGDDALADRMDRLKAIGNGQDCTVAATAYQILNNE